MNKDGQWSVVIHASVAHPAVGGIRPQYVHKPPHPTDYSKTDKHPVHGGVALHTG